MRTDIITKNAQGEIIIPEQYGFIMKQPYIRHDEPTTHPGFYHRHIIRGATLWDFELALERFFIPMTQNVPGFVYLGGKDTSNPRTGPDSYISDIFYAVDGPMPEGTKGNRLVGAMLYPYL